MNVPTLKARRIGRVAPGWLIFHCDKGDDSPRFVDDVLECARNHHVRRVLVDLADQGPPTPKMVGQLRRLRQELADRSGLLRVIGVEPSSEIDLPIYSSLETALFTGHVPNR